MRNAIRIGSIAIALVVSACGAPGAEPDETTSTAGAETATTRPATTTTQATTTTTQVVVDPEFQALMVSIEEGQSALISGRLEGSIEITGLDETEAGLSEASILFNSAFDTVTGDASFSIDMSSMAGAIEVDETDPFAGMAEAFLGEMEFRQIGDRVYVKFPFFTAMFGAETDWVSMPAEEGDDFTSGFETVPSDPHEILEAYEGAEATIENLGAETVNGVQTTHYVITLNTDAMDLSEAERAELEQSGLFAEGIIPMDIWISDDGYLVRLRFEIDGTGIDAPPDEAFERMTLRYDLLDINGDVVIEPPPASEVTDVEDLEGLGFDLEGTTP